MYRIDIYSNITVGKRVYFAVCEELGIKEGVPLNRRTVLESVKFWLKEKNLALKKFFRTYPIPDQTSSYVCYKFFVSLREEV